MFNRAEDEREMKKIIGIAITFSAVLVIVLLAYVFVISPEDSQPPQRSIPVYSIIQQDGW